jgi:hypothetical protein
VILTSPCSAQAVDTQESGSKLGTSWAPSAPAREEKARFGRGEAWRAGTKGKPW